MDKTVLVPLLEGFEEIEAITLIDVLRRAGAQVIVAGEAVGPVVGAHGIAVTADRALAGVAGAELHMIALPGGMPGAQHLTEHPRVQALIRELAAAGKYTAAICAAPMALAAAGVVGSRRATCFPGFEKHLAGAELVGDAVVVDGTLVTSRGPGTAMEFALALVERLGGAAASRAVGKQLLVR